jgi:hypothetical protein
MDYFETLRRNGWLADPGDRIRVEVVHAEGCAANVGRPCSCDPRLVLAADPLPRPEKEEEKDLPVFVTASGE